MRFRLTSNQHGSYKQCPTADPTDDRMGVNGSDGPTTPRVVPVPGPQGLETEEKNGPVKGENGPNGPADAHDYYRSGPVAADELSWKETMNGLYKASRWMWWKVIVKPLKEGSLYYLNYTPEEE